MRAFSRNLLLSACLILPINAHALDIGIGGENGVNASVGDNGSGGLGVDASVGGSSGVNASADVGGRSGGGLGADVNASVGGSNGVNADVNASVGGSSGVNAGVNASVGGSDGISANVGANVGARAVSVSASASVSAAPVRPARLEIPAVAPPIPAARARCLPARCAMPCKPITICREPSRSSSPAVVSIFWAADTMRR